ncbi:hypothetical protein U9662_001882 [Enterobacter cloacae]|nr:hypothetical protein [Enterobacter cloacae]
MTTFAGSTGLPQYPHFVELHIWIPLLRQQVAQAAKNHLEEVQLYGLLPSWFACEINHSHPRLPYRRPAERLHLMRVNLSTSSDCSYAVGGYFVCVLPWWFVVRLGESSKSLLYSLVKFVGTKKYSNTLLGLYEVRK